MTAVVVGHIDLSVIQARQDHKEELSKRHKLAQEKKAKEAAEEARLRLVLKANAEGYQSPNNAFADAFQKLDKNEQKQINQMVKQTGKKKASAA